MTAPGRPAATRPPARPAGPRPLRLGSLCSGYEGLGMAIAQVLDVELAWVADPDPGAAAILAHHHPDVPNLGDITTVDWNDVAPIDVLCGGYPCPPFSVAGLRKGTADERHIWPYIASALRVLRPRIAIFENVAGHLRLGFDAVLADLARLGFDAEWCVASASAVGAPHQRRRLFFIARPADTDRPGLEGRRLRRATPEHGRAAAHAHSIRSDRPATEHRQDGRQVPTRDAATNAPRDGRHEGRPEPARLVRRPDAALRRDAAPDADRDGRARGPQRHGLTKARLETPQRDDADGCVLDWGDHGPAIDRWARILGRPAPAPTEPGRNGQPRLNPVFVEWLMGLPASHVTAVPGLSRNQQLTALGNGVVPQQGAVAIAHLLDRMEATA